jgi:hypothetical protein
MTLAWRITSATKFKSLNQAVESHTRTINQERLCEGRGLSRVCYSKISCTRWMDIYIPHSKNYLLKSFCALGGQTVTVVTTTSKFKIRSLKVLVVWSTLEAVRPQAMGLGSQSNRPPLTVKSLWIRGWRSDRPWGHSALTKSLVDKNTLCIFWCFSSHSAHSHFFTFEIVEGSAHSVFQTYLPQE